MKALMWFCLFNAVDVAVLIVLDVDCHKLGWIRTAIGTLLCIAMGWTFRAYLVELDKAVK